MNTPLTFKEFKDIVTRLKTEDDYINECYKLHFEICEDIISFDLSIELVDKMFTPIDSNKEFNTFSWWVYDSEFGTKDLYYWTGESGEIEHNVTKIEDIYRELCSQINCEPVWE